MRKALYTVYYTYEDGRIASTKYTSKSKAIQEVREMKEDLKAEGIIKATLNDLKTGKADIEISLK